jgi:hypothetical protein
VRTCTALSICCGLWLVGCGSSSPPPTDDPPIPVAVREEPPAKTNADPATAAEVTVSGFRLQVPAGWRQAELTPAQQGFVDARFEIPALGDDVKLTLSTIGGGVDANVERWIGQVQLPEGATPITESFEVDGIPVTWIDLSGEFRGMQQAPQAGWRMLGAAFDGEPRDFYVKLTGPAAALSQIEDEFRGFVKSVRLVRK